MQQDPPGVLVTGAANQAADLSRPRHLPPGRVSLFTPRFAAAAARRQRRPASLARVTAAGSRREIPVHEMLPVREDLFPTRGLNIIHRFALVPG